MQKQSCHPALSKYQLKIVCSLMDRTLFVSTAQSSMTFLEPREKVCIDAIPVAEETILDDLDDESCSFPFSHVGAEPVSISRKLQKAEVKVVRFPLSIIQMLLLSMILAATIYCSRDFQQALAISLIVETETVNFSSESELIFRKL